MKAKKSRFVFTIVIKNKDGKMETLPTPPVFIDPFFHISKVLVYEGKKGEETLENTVEVVNEDEENKSIFGMDFGLDKLTIYRSYTCCNVEVYKKNGTEIICPECKEYCTTKGK